MHVGRRGLVVPQNTFLENIVRRSNGLHPHFVLGNAQILDNPIVYVSDGFCQLTGFKRQDVMQKSCSCEFLFSELTDDNSIKDVKEALDEKRDIQVEILGHRKDETPLWFLLHVGPIVNEKGEVVLFLVSIKDITQYKDPIESQNINKGWARLNKTISRSRSVLNAFKSKATNQRNAQQITHLMSLNTEFLPEYKNEVPQSPKGVILHYSTPKTTWDWTILLLTLYTSVSVPFLVCFGGYEKIHQSFFEVMNYLDTCVDFIFLTDIVLNFMTTFVTADGEMVSMPKLIRIHYLKGWFLLDLVSSLPYGLLNFITGEYITILGILKVVRLLRLVRVARKLDKYLEYGAVTFVLILFTFCLCAHWMACIWYIIGYKYDGLAPAGWIRLMSEATKQPFFNGTEGGPTLPSAYVSALYYCMTSLTSVGFGNIAPNTTAEKLFGSITMLFGSLLFALIFGQVTAIIQQAQKQSSKYHAIIDNMRAFNNLYKVPQLIGSRVIDYFMSTWALNKGVDTDEVLKYCPKDLQADICVHLNRNVLYNNSAFREASMGVLRAVARNLWICHVAPGDRVVHEGESLDVLYFISHGSLEVKQDDVVVGLLGESDCFGDRFWDEATVGQSAADVYALTYSDLHCITRDALLEVLSFYPEFGLKFANNINLSYILRDQVKVRKTNLTLVRQESERTDSNPNTPKDEPDFKNSLLPHYLLNKPRKLSLVEELTHGYESTEDINVDAGPSFKTHLDRAREFVDKSSHSYRLVIPEQPDHVDEPAPQRQLSESESSFGHQRGEELLESLTEMKSEVRREIELMNIKMGFLEEQIGTIVSLLRNQEHTERNSSQMGHHRKHSPQTQESVANSSLDSRPNSIEVDPHIESRSATPDFGDNPQDANNDHDEKVTNPFKAATPAKPRTPKLPQPPRKESAGQSRRKLLHKPTPPPKPQDAQLQLSKQGSTENDARLPDWLAKQQEPQEKPLPDWLAPGEEKPSSSDNDVNAVAARLLLGRRSNKNDDDGNLGIDNEGVESYTPTAISMQNRKGKKK